MPRFEKPHFPMTIKVTVASGQHIIFISFTFFPVLDVNAFERLLGPCMELMKRNINDYEQQLLQIFGSKTNISDVR